MKFSYSAVWEDTVAMIRANHNLLAALAGVFLFLPTLLLAYFLPAPEPSDPSRIFAELLEYFRHNILWFLLANLVGMVGMIAMFLLVFGRDATVGGIIYAAARLLPFYFLAGLVSGLIMGLGFALLIVPGLYLFGRMAIVGAIVVAEDRRNPIDAIKRSFELTKGNGWSVLGLVLIVGIAAVIVAAVVKVLFGLLFLLAGQRIGALLSMILEALTSAAVSTLMLVLSAAIYRRLADKLSAVFE